MRIWALIGITATCHALASPPASLPADNENQRNYQALYRDPSSNLEPWVGAIVGPYHQGLESPVSLGAHLLWLGCVGQGTDRRLVGTRGCVWACLVVAAMVAAGQWRAVPYAPHRTELPGAPASAPFLARRAPRCSCLWCATSTAS